MRCTSPGQMRHPKTHEWVLYPCGQCTPCRLKKRSSLVCRNLLESRLALSSSFWTLTLDENGLQTLQERGARKMMSNFMAALRASEDRAGNSTPIRFFGCLEFGGKFGRPHFHMMLYNLVKNYTIPPRYQSGLPRPLQYTKLWPHGSYDPADFNNATLNYVAEYMMKHDPEAPPIPFRSIRPAIGFYGIQSLAVFLAQKHGKLPGRPTYFEIGQRKFPLDNWSRQTFDKEFRKAGGSYGFQGSPRDRTLDRLAWEETLNSVPHKLDKEMRDIMRLEALKHAKETRKQISEAKASAIYFERQEAILLAS